MSKLNVNLYFYITWFEVNSLDPGLVIVILLLQ